MASASPHHEKRLFEHFVIAGLKENAEPISSTALECGRRITEPPAPITDICVIFPTLGETVPENFEMIQSTPLGYQADLNHGSLRVPPCFICFARGYHKQPLVDIGVLDTSKDEKTTVDSCQLKTTPSGKIANVNNASQNIFLTYRTAPPNSAPSQLVVTHICVIIASKGEIPPHTYYKIPKNLNKGLIGSEVYICYKKSLGSAKRLAYKPAILDYFPKSCEPQDDASGDMKLLANVPLFCLPMGAVIECWPGMCQQPERTYSTFVLTDELNQKYYGASVTFYEKFTGTLTPEQLEKLEVTTVDADAVGSAIDDTPSTNDPAEQLSFHTNLSICIVSRYPFFQSFKRFLFYIHRMSQCDDAIQAVPIERYISHLMYEVSFPTVRRPRVLMQLGNEMVTFEVHEDQQLPQNGAALFETLKSLGPENLMHLVLLALLEQKILIHSLRPWLLTAVAESVCTLILPFHWQCPYVPQCPLSLAGVLHAPLPFIAGVDSRYFDLYEDPPLDVTCFDLDTATIRGRTARHEVKLSLLPKRQFKQLKKALDLINNQIQMLDSKIDRTKGKLISTELQQKFQTERRSYELSIQDAFIKFMASLMADYQSFLRPIVSAPLNKDATDTMNLFDIEGFLRTRDKDKQDFLKRFCSTQLFSRFIEERSFVSDKSTYNTFFDECIEKVIFAELTNTDVPELIETESALASNTVFIPPPEPLLNADGAERQFKYNSFPRSLDVSLFQLNQLNVDQADAPTTHPVDADIGRSAAVRTKPEIRSSLLMAANAVFTQPLTWPNIVLFYAYSLWFMQLPSMLAVAKNKRKALRLAFHVLARLEATEIIPFDQICHRILIEMCGQCGEPHLAVRVLLAMRRAGLVQNAVTYGLYHRAVMHSNWPSPGRVRAEQIWRRLRLVLLTMAYFRKGRTFTGLPLERASLADAGYISERTTPTAVDAKEAVDVVVEAPRSSDDDVVVVDDDDGRTELQPAEYSVTYTPLNEPKPRAASLTPSPPKDAADSLGLDPLGAFHLQAHERQRSAPPEVRMSPARAKFLAEHNPDAQLFQEELTPKQRKEKSSGWMKSLTNSPFIKMVISRSQTTDNVDKTSITSDGSGNSDKGTASFTSSPSFQNLVSTVKRSYDEVIKEGGMSSRFRSGVNSIVADIRVGINRSGVTSGVLFGGDGTNGSDKAYLDEKHPTYTLESGSSGTLLDEKFWNKDLFDDEQPSTSSSIMEITLCVATPCPHCDVPIFDEEIISGWKNSIETKPPIEAEDQNMNTECPHCRICATEPDAKTGSFAPMLHINFQTKQGCRLSWYQPSTQAMQQHLSASAKPAAPKGKPELPAPLTVAFLSPLVVRRELESLVTGDITALKDKSLMESNPVIFWNLVYYFRRLGLPSHLLTWLGPKVHIRCVYDRPHSHSLAQPLYLSSPQNAVDTREEEAVAVRIRNWRQVTQAIQDNKMFTAIQTLINESRVVKDGTVSLGPHFPIFRDIQFASLDAFGRALNRTNVDDAYYKEFLRLPPKIREILPAHDYPPTILTRACRMIFLPLDLF